MAKEQVKELTSDEVGFIIKDSLKPYLSDTNSNVQEHQLNGLSEAIVNSEKMRSTDYLEVAIYVESNPLRLRMLYTSWYEEDDGRVKGIKLMAGSPVNSDDLWGAVHDLASKLSSELGLPCKVLERR